LINPFVPRTSGVKVANPTEVQNDGKRKSQYVLPVICSQTKRKLRKGGITVDKQFVANDFCYIFFHSLKQYQRHLPSTTFRSKICPLTNLIAQVVIQDVEFITINFRSGFIISYIDFENDFKGRSQICKEQGVSSINFDVFLFQISPATYMQ